MSNQNYINESSQLQKVCTALKAEGAVAVDTEFVWTQTYLPRLGIIQLAGAHCAYIVDYCEIEDLSPLAALLEDGEVVKLFHDAHQDVSILNYYLSCSAINIFDTQRGAAMAGMEQSLSLEKLLNRLCNVSLPKTETRTNWVQRPLKEEQIQYALDDVKYMVSAYNSIIDLSKEHKTTRWIFEEMEIYNNIVPFPHRDGVERLFLKFAKRVNRRDYGRLYALIDAIESCARQADRPRDYIFKKDRIPAVLENRIESPNDLVKKRFISEKQLKKYGEALYSALVSEDKAPEDLIGRVKRPRPDSPQAIDATASFQTAIGDCAAAHGIAGPLVATRSDVASKVRDALKSKKIPQFSGWRGELLNEMTASFFAPLLNNK